MRKLLLLVPFWVAACTVAPAAPVTPLHGTVPGHICNAVGTERFIGQPGTVESGTAIMRATNSAILRWAPVGYMLTMDYSASRVTVRLDTAYKITAINCG